MIPEIEKLRVLIQKIMFNESGLGDRFAYFLDTRDESYTQKNNSLYTKMSCTNDLLQKLTDFLRVNTDV